MRRRVFGNNSVNLIRTVCLGLIAIIVLAAGSSYVRNGLAGDIATGDVAIVPTVVIYPGDEIQPGQLEAVAVNNPNLRSDYVRSVDEVIGRISRRTLLPGRVIPVSSVRDAYAITRGSTLRLVYSDSRLVITATGTPLADAMIGDTVRVRNLDTGVMVTGTVMADGTVRVLAR